MLWFWINISYPHKKRAYASTLSSLPVVNIMTDNFVHCLMELSYVSSDRSDLFIVILYIHVIALLPPWKTLLCIHTWSEDAAASGERRRGCGGFWGSTGASLFLLQPFCFITLSHNLTWCQCWCNPLAPWTICLLQKESVISTCLEIKRKANGATLSAPYVKLRKTCFVSCFEWNSLCSSTTFLLFLFFF